MGWMEDIKRVISFDSVEEFWGCVIVPMTLDDDRVDPSFQQVIQ
jgi:hypothetical protein